MSSPFSLVIKGKFVIVGKQPDGDSVRFIADNLENYEELQRNFLIKPSRDNSVQLRFEGIDAPEVHYGSDAQPLGEVSRDELLAHMGFANIEFKGNRVEKANPDTVFGAILTQAADANGRPICYVLLQSKAEGLADGNWVRVDTSMLKETSNFHMLEKGLAYYTVYTSTPKTHRRLFRKAAVEARAANLGVWAVDSTDEFRLEDKASISAPDGQLILPKLFRRSIDYLKAVDGGFRGNLKDWLLDVSKGSRNENDAVIIRDAIELKLSDLIGQRNNSVVLKEDILNITFVEKK